MTLILSQKHFRQIFEHVRAEAPNEACGLLAGVAEQVTHVFPATNVAENPMIQYLMDPHDQLHHFQAMEEQGLELLGIYHSHPASPAYPSPTDVLMAFYPEAVYAIVSLVCGDNPVMRAFRMVDGQISEVGLRVIPPQDPNLEHPSESVKN